jgi:uncharacterized repeat protein (TIGR03803 family)
MEMTMARTNTVFALAALSLALAPNATSGQTLTVLYNFGSNPGDPTYPREIGNIVEAKDGSIITTSQQGGATGHGTVFKITTDGKLTVLHSFNGASEGAGPQSGVVIGPDGCYYGTCFGGGAKGTGILWKVAPDGTFSLLHTLEPGNGSFPISGPVLGKDGSFYGATSYIDNFLLGAVYRMTPTGGYTALYKFNGKDAATIGYFASGLTTAKDGNFYGTTFRGGAGFGTVYKVTPAGQISAIHKFDGTHGATAYNLTQASDGNLYGACTTGGTANFGLVYKLTPAGEFTVLHTFTGPDGAAPVAGLVEAKDGYLYGNTKAGGKGGRGVIFRIKPDGSDFVVVYNLNINMTEGRYCVQGGIQHSNGNLYNVVNEGGTKGQGIVYCLDMKTFSLSPSSGKAGTPVSLSGFNFTGATSVTIGGIAAAFKVDSDQKIMVTVPAGARTGVVKVVTPKVTLTSKTPFQITL